MTTRPTCAIRCVCQACCGTWLSNQCTIAIRCGLLDGTPIRVSLIVESRVCHSKKENICTPLKRSRVNLFVLVYMAALKLVYSTFNSILLDYGYISGL